MQALNTLSPNFNQDLNHALQSQNAELQIFAGESNLQPGESNLFTIELNNKEKKNLITDVEVSALNQYNAGEGVQSDQEHL